MLLPWIFPAAGLTQSVFFDKLYEKYIPSHQKGLIVLPYQEYDPAFEDPSEPSDKDTSRSSASSRFHRRGSANVSNEVPDVPASQQTEQSASRFHRHGAENTPTDFEDGDGFFRLEKTDGPLSDSEDLFADFEGKGSDRSHEGGLSFGSASSSKSFAGFFILTALLVAAVCATFIIKNRLSQNNGHLSAGADSSTASESTGTSATEPVNPDTEATEEPAAEPTETQTTAAPTETQTTTAAASPAYQTLKTGDKNKNVTEMQKRLAALGYIDDKSCTGYFGEYTEKIVRRFQKKAGLPETGIADSETLTRLYADDAPKWK